MPYRSHLRLMEIEMSSRCAFRRGFYPGVPRGWEIQGTPHPGDGCGVPCISKSIGGAA